MGKAWELIKAGLFEDACAAADEEYAATRSLLPLRNKLYALLSLSRYEDAITLSNSILELDGRQCQSDFLLLGTGLWLGGKREEAIAAWKNSDDTKYADAAGGVETHLILFYASVVLAREDLLKPAVNRSRALAAKGPAQNWPGPLAQFICGKMTEDQLLSAVSSVPALHLKQTCQAKFYLGTVRLRNGDGTGYRSAMNDVRGSDGVCRTKCEFYLASAAV